MDSPEPRRQGVVWPGAAAGRRLKGTGFPGTCLGTDLVKDCWLRASGIPVSKNWQGNGVLRSVRNEESPGPSFRQSFYLWNSREYHP